MANTIRIKRSTGSSNPTSLENAEIAFREGDEVLIIGKGTEEQEDLLHLSKLLVVREHFLIKQQQEQQIMY